MMSRLSHRAATVLRAILRTWKRWSFAPVITDYKGWRITPASTFSEDKGWSPDLKITALDAPEVEHHFPTDGRKFFPTKAEADLYATNMGIALVDTALGGWRIVGGTPPDGTRADVIRRDQARHDPRG
jgi:hypothetical protein